MILIKNKNIDLLKEILKTLDFINIDDSKEYILFDIETKVCSSVCNKVALLQAKNYGINIFEI